MAERIIVFAAACILVGLAWFSGYIAGRSDEKEKWNARYRDLCTRLISALKRRSDD